MTPSLAATRRHVLTTLAALTTAGLAATSTLTHAQDAAKDYPSKVVTLVVPYAAGGSSDTRARQIAEKLGGYFGKTVIVENKPARAATSAPSSSPRPPRTATPSDWATSRRWRSTRRCSPSSATTRRGIWCPW